MDPYRTSAFDEPAPTYNRKQKWSITIALTIGGFLMLKAIDQTHHEPARQRAEQFVRVLHPDWIDARVYCRDIDWNISDDLCTVSYVEPGTPPTRVTVTLYCNREDCRLSY